MLAQRPVTIEQPKQLLVEGKDAKDFFDGMLNRLCISNVQVQNFGGIKELRAFLKGMVPSADFVRVDSIGVVRDAEDDPNAAFRSVQDALTHAGLSAPRDFEQSTGDRPKVSVLIIPDASTPGMLEHLCRRAVATPAVSQCVEAYLRCMAGNGLKPRNEAKAWTCAYLACCPESKPSVGIAAKAGYWPFDHAVFDHVRGFLQRL